MTSRQGLEVLGKDSSEGRGNCLGPDWRQGEARGEEGVAHGGKGTGRTLPCMMGTPAPRASPEKSVSIQA